MPKDLSPTLCKKRNATAARFRKVSSDSFEAPIVEEEQDDDGADTAQPPHDGASTSGQQQAMDGVVSGDGSGEQDLVRNLISLANQLVQRAGDDDDGDAARALGDVVKQHAASANNDDVIMSAPHSSDEMDVTNSGGSGTISATASPSAGPHDTSTKSADVTGANSRYRKLGPGYTVLEPESKPDAGTSGAPGVAGAEFEQATLNEFHNITSKLEALAEESEAVVDSMQVTFSLLHVM